MKLHASLHKRCHTFLRSEKALAEKPQQLLTRVLYTPQRGALHMDCTCAEHVTQLQVTATITSCCAFRCCCFLTVKSFVQQALRLNKANICIDAWLLLSRLGMRFLCHLNVKSKPQKETFVPVLLIQMRVA